MKRFFFLLLWIFSGCSYHKDKLVIKNNSKEDISYAIFIKTKNDSVNFVYKIVSASQEFSVLNESSPIVRNYLSDEIDEFSCDSILYLYIYDKVDKENFYKNMDSIIYGKNAKFYKYSKKELDSMDWYVTIR
jgi:hypothetical protein